MSIRWTCLACGKAVDCNDPRTAKAIDESHTCDRGTVAAEMERLKAAEQRVRDVERTDRRFIRADDPETTQWMCGYDEALDAVIKALDGGEQL